MKDFTKPSKAIKEIKLNWNERLKQHQVEGYSKQVCLNLKQEATKYIFLEYLNKQNGPFVNAEEVSAFMNTSVESIEKNTRLMLEVKYARMTCTFMKPTATVFRLKRDYKNLCSEEYAEHLTSYLNNARSYKNISIDDLNNVLIGLSSGVSSSVQHSQPDSSSIDTDVSLSVGNHVTVFWFDQTYA